MEVPIGHKLIDEQNDLAWHMERLGHDYTALSATSTRSIENIPWMRRRFPNYKGTWKYMRYRRLILENQIMPVPNVPLSEETYPMAHGSFYEQYAADALKWIGKNTGILVSSGRRGITEHFLSDSFDWNQVAFLREGGLWEHSCYSWLRASPDLEAVETTPFRLLSEVKSPVKPWSLNPQKLVSGYFSQVQTQMFVCGSYANLLFCYHPLSKQVTAVLVKECRQRFNDEVLPAMAAFHQALANPRDVVLDYEAEFSFEPRKDKTEYITLLDRCVVPEVFPDIPDVEQKIQKCWQKRLSIGVPDHADPAFMAKHRALRCSRLVCHRHGQYVGCPICGELLYCSRQCMELDASRHQAESACRAGRAMVV